MANVKNPNNILLGTGILYLDGQDVGQLSGDVVLSYGTEYKKIEAGFPKTTIKSKLIAESAQITAGFLEVDMQQLATLLPLFTLETVSGGDVAITNEWVGEVYEGRWKGCVNRKWTEDAVSVKLASKLTAQALAGATTIYVNDASLFSPADPILLVKSGTTEAATIAALGVDTGENSLTLTAGITNAFAAGDFAANTAVTLVEGTDYYLDRINGCVSVVPSATKINEGDTVSISYTYTAVTATKLSAGGAISTTVFGLEVQHTRDDGKILKVKFSKAQITGNFELPFHEDSETILNVTIESVADSTKAAGKQLVEISLENAA